MQAASRSATQRRRSTSRNARTPPSDDNKPPSNLTPTRLPETGDNPGNGNIGSFMAGAVSLKSHESAYTTKFYTKSAIYATPANPQRIIQVSWIGLVMDHATAWPR